MNENTSGDNDPTQIIDEDKTFESNDSLEGIPDEDDLGIEDKKTEEKKKSEDDETKSEIFQKRKWREKFLKSQGRIRELELEIARKADQKKETQTEDKELNAQRYIREQARKEYENILAEQKANEDKALENFQTNLDSAIEDHPELTEDELLDVCEEYSVEPAVAAKILLKHKEGETRKKKPSLPKPKQASTEVSETESKSAELPKKRKTLYELAQEIKASLKK